MKKVIQRVENDEIDLKSAMAHTLDFERSLIEKEVFTHFEIVDERMKGVMTKLEKETKNHVKKVEEMMTKLRKQGR